MNNRLPPEPPYYELDEETRDLFTAVLLLAMTCVDSQHHEPTALDLQNLVADVGLRMGVDILDIRDSMVEDSRAQDAQSSPDVVDFPSLRVVVDNKDDDKPKPNQHEVPAVEPLSREAVRFAKNCHIMMVSHTIKQQTMSQTRYRIHLDGAQETLEFSELEDAHYALSVLQLQYPGETLTIEPFEWVNPEHTRLGRDPDLH